MFCISISLTHNHRLFGSIYVSNLLEKKLKCRGWKSFHCQLRAINHWVNLETREYWEVADNFGGSDDEWCHYGKFWVMDILRGGDKKSRSWGT